MKSNALVVVAAIAIFVGCVAMPLCWASESVQISKGQTRREIAQAERLATWMDTAMGESIARYGFPDTAGRRKGLAKACRALAVEMELELTSSEK